MSSLRSSEALWKEGGGYYTGNPEELRRHPLLPDLQRLRDRRIFELFVRFGRLGPGSRVLEIGCGQSMWLPCLADKVGCQVAGIDIEPNAAELARANLAGAGRSGEIYCRDAFDVTQNRDLLGTFDLLYSMGVMEHFADASDRLAALAHYLKPDGRMLTMVPNLQGVNWLLQRLGSLQRLNMHVVYDTSRLVAIHRRAGLAIQAAGYVGFHDGFVSASDLDTAPRQRKLHEHLCRYSHWAGVAWIRLGRERLTPESRWISPHVFCVGSRGQAPGRL
jgi:2-polyprenyl-6-hydroxyphenyl methylase/3-demethylubiquinone-9 3-methyltransferase